MEHVPLFSPSQISSQERVISSIFSPNFAGGVTAGCGPPKTPAAPRRRGKNHAISNGIPATGSSETSEETKNAREQRFAPRDTATGNDESTDQFFSPYSRHTQRATVSKNSGLKTLSRPSDGSNDQFFSPDLEQSKNILSPFSAGSPLTFATCASKKSLSIDSLGYDFVRNCQSPEELKQIVSVLTSGSQRHYPYLVRTAQKQLRAINGSPEYSEPREAHNESFHSSEPLALHDKFRDVRLDSQGMSIANQSSLNYSPSPQNQSYTRKEQHSQPLMRTRILPISEDGNLRVTDANTDAVDNGLASGDGAQESTLVMSLSSSLLLEESVASSDKENKVWSFPVDTKSESVPLPAQLPAWRHHPSLATSKSPTNAESVQERDSMRAKLSEEIRELTEKVRKLESDRKLEHSSFLRKIETLEKVKKEAEQATAALEKRVASSATEQSKLKESLTKARHEMQSLRKVLHLEREAAKKKASKALALENELRQKVAELTDKLAQSQEQARRSCQSVERKLKHQFRKEASVEKEALNRSLREARDNLEEVKTERNLIIHTLQKTMGGKMSLMKIGSLSKQEREKVVHMISKKAASTRAASKALAKSLASSEKERRVAIDARNKASRRLKELDLSWSRLERENVLLTRQIQELTDELTSSRNYIDTLLNSKKEASASERDMREKAYKHKIRHLELQVLQGESSVSLGLYRKAVNDARARTEECEASRRQINALTSKVGNLQKKLNENKPSSQGALRVEKAPTVHVVENAPRASSAAPLRPCVPIESKHDKLESPTRGSKKDFIAGRNTETKNCEKKNANEVDLCQRPSPAMDLANNMPSAPGVHSRSAATSRHAKLETLRSKHLPRKVSPLEISRKSGRPIYSAGKAETVTPTQSCEKENKTFSAPSGSASKKFDRNAVLRAAGGKAGLSATLKQLRSPLSIKSAKPLRPKN